MGKYIKDYQVNNFSDEDLDEIKKSKPKVKKFKDPKSNKGLKKKVLRRAKDEFRD